MIHRLRTLFVGDRAFYRSVVAIVLPIIVQMSVTNLVNLLDNIMVGQLGTAELSGVAIGNQLIFVFNISVFGGLSGPGIFTAQYFGAGDMEGVRNSLRLKLWISFILFALSAVVFLGFGRDLVANYLTGEGDAASAALMLEHALDYLHIMLIGFVPVVLSFAYAGTLRECGETMLPMKAGIAAVLTNLGGNYVLIYGHLGFPALGVKGAAIATVISRFVEFGIILYATRSGSPYAFLHGVLKTMRLKWGFVKAVLMKGAPLLANEFLWSTGMATLTRIYSMRGLNVLAGYNIASVVNQMFIVFFISMGNAISVMAGQSLGANRMEKARSDVRYLMALSFTMCLVIGGIMAVLSPYFPHLYNTTEDVYQLATRFILTMALFMPMYSISHACYFALRAGGTTFITFLFDSGYMWAIHIPLALALTHWTDLPIWWLFPLCEGAALIKMVLGLYFVKRGVWVRNIVTHTA